MEFDVILLQFLSNKLEIFVSCNLKLFALCFYMYFFNKNLIVLHHSDNNFPFWHLYQIHTFNSNLKNEGMLISHLRHTRKVRPRPWDVTQNPGPCGGTLGWDLGVGPWSGTMGWDPKGETMGWDPKGGTMGWDPRVGPWNETLEWDSHVGFFNILFFIRITRSSNIRLI